MAQVQLIGVGKRFGSTQVVRDVNLSIEDNQFIVLVGPSGCGKSTVLRMIAGLETTSSGQIRIGGRDVTHVSPKDRNVAMVFQNYALYPHMSVRENMGFSLKMAGHTKNQIADQVLKTADILELIPYLDRKPSELSGGQRQRVAMGRAMVRKPDVFLFDEPLSNLDAKLRTQMRRELRKMHIQLQTTTIYVTHDQVEAMTLADRIVVLKDGMVQQVGTPVEVFEKPTNMFVAQFIGNPPMNIMDATFLLKNGKPCVQAGSSCFLLPEGKGTGFEEGKPIKAGIRPDAIKMGDAVMKLPKEWHCTGTVVISEILGGQSLLEITVDDNTLMAEVEGRILTKAGDKIPIGFEMDRMILFDPETTKALP